ncbi:hypothetical protein H2200_006190 [Cladophialophora chaetospira]|uniref:Uncharacterized protein n=1 Tax=Cladophialophora chaetospira TaxID=386627 RepID=A0AA38XAQ1_9EURO|nr:hypothetical protein H2200_006190 [Cladophialophora chaetospira]
MTSLRMALAVAQHSTTRVFEKNQPLYAGYKAQYEVRPLFAPHIITKTDPFETSKPDSQSAKPKAVPLEDIAPDFSFSEYLSPSPRERKKESLLILLYDKPLDATHLVLLALNEECRKLKRGCLYHLPLRSDAAKGHPCDMVFVDEPWDENDTTTWDALDWARRFELCDAEVKLDPHEYVIPVCCRIMKFDLPQVLNVSGYHRRHTSESDPVIREHSNVVAWSRPLVDLSRVLLLYPHEHAMAVICHTTAAEYEPRCQTFPTPNDLSETFLPLQENNPTKVFGRSPEQSATASSAQMALPVSNLQVVLTLLILWNKGRRLTLPRPINYRPIQEWEKEWGSVRFLWQEVHSRVRDHDLTKQKAMLEFWPKE